MPAPIIHKTFDAGHRNNDLTSFAGLIWNKHDDDPELAAHLVQLKGDQCKLPQKEIDGIIKQMMGWAGGEGVASGQPKDINAEIKDAHDLYNENLPDFSYWVKPFGPGQAVMLFGATRPG